MLLLLLLWECFALSNFLILMFTKREDLEDEDEDEEPLYFFRFFSVDFSDPALLDFLPSDSSSDSDEYTDLSDDEDEEDEEDGASDEDDEEDDDEDEDEGASHSASLLEPVLASSVPSSSLIVSFSIISSSSSISVAFGRCASVSSPS